MRPQGRRHGWLRSLRQYAACVRRAKMVGTQPIRTLTCPNDPDTMGTQGLPRGHKDFLGDISAAKVSLQSLQASTKSPSALSITTLHKHPSAPDSLGESLQAVAWSSKIHRTKSMLRVEDTVASAPPPVLDAAPSPLGASSEAPTAGAAASSPPRSRGEASIGAHSTSRSVRGGPCSRVEIMPRRAEPARDMVSINPEPMQKVTSHKKQPLTVSAPALLTNGPLCGAVYGNHNRIRT